MLEFTWRMVEPLRRTLTVSMGVTLIFSPVI